MTGTEVELRARIEALERRNAELEAAVPALSAREALLQAAEKAAGLGSWMWDLATNQVSWSTNMYVLWGRDPLVDEANTENFFGSVHPDDVEHLEQATRNGLLTDEAPTVQFRVLHDDGTVLFISMSGLLLRDANGNAERMVGACRDVTAAKEGARAQAILQMASEAMGVGIFFWEPTTSVLVWSREMFDIFGTDTPHTTTEFERCVLGEDRAALQVHRRQMTDTGSAGPTPLRIRRVDGTTRHVILSAGRIDEGGGVGGSVVDVTAQALLEQRLREGQRMAALGRLAGSVAHDFNNLLTIIHGNASLVQMDQPQDEAIGQILEATRQGGALTQQLLDFSNRKKLVREPVDLRSIVGDQLKLSGTLLGPDVLVAVGLGNEPIMVNADEGGLRQVALNLFTNARDAMTGGGRLDVHVQPVQVQAPGELEARAFAEFRVTDSGAGMAESTRSQLFEPFFTTKAPGRGTGLGLTTVFRIVQDHGGHIEVRSSPGAGCTIYVRLPLLHGQCPTAELEEHDGYERVVMLVEDVFEVRRVVARFLEAGGWSVLEFGDPRDALAHPQRPHTLLTDVRMPHISGVELARGLRTRWPGLPVLYMTGHSFDEDLNDAPVLQKPFGREALFEALMAVESGS